MTAGVFDLVVDRVARCSWHIAHYCPLLTKKLVQQARLANVWAANNRNRYFTLTCLHAALRREAAQALNEYVEQVTRADPVLRADWINRIKAERGKLVRGTLAINVVCLVGGKKDGFSALAQQ